MVRWCTKIAYIGQAAKHDHPDFDAIRFAETRVSMAASHPSYVKAVDAMVDLRGLHNRHVFCMRLDDGESKQVKRASQEARLEDGGVVTDTAFQPLPSFRYGLEDCLCTTILEHSRDNRSAIDIVAIHQEKVYERREAYQFVR
jgi:hypothetical protein